MIQKAFMYGRTSIISPLKMTVQSFDCAQGEIKTLKKDIFDLFNYNTPLQELTSIAFSSYYSFITSISGIKELQK